MEAFRNMYYDGRRQRYLRCTPLELELASCETRRSEYIKSLESLPAPPAKTGWFGGKKPDVELSNSSQIVRAEDVETCNALAHRLWSCRALALGCGGHLATLQKARDAGGGECVTEQKAIGECVSMELDVLRERDKLEKGMAVKKAEDEKKE